MNIADGQSGDGGDALDRQAAHWLARMRAPDAEASREAFEAWLAAAPGHRSAYNRAAEIFAMGKLLAEPAASVPAATPARVPRKIPATVLGALAAGAVAIAGWALWYPEGAGPDRREAVAATTIDARTIATVAGGTRMVRLADGSSVHLAGDTALRIEIAAGRRDLKLLRGTARFEVAHEQRPFVVRAGGGSVTARGTVFEVALARSGKVDVRLLQGAVDVALPHARSASQPPVRQLAAGESLSFVSVAEPEAAPTPRTGAAMPADTGVARDFEATPVAELIALANRGAARPIRLGDPELGAKHVSGRFRVDDTGLLARRLGALFGRSVDMDDRHEIVLAAAAGPPATRALDTRQGVAADKRSE